MKSYLLLIFLKNYDNKPPFSNRKNTLVMSNMTAAYHEISLDIDEAFVDYLIKQFMNETLHFHITPNF